MIDLKKATKEELMDLLLVDVRAIESMIAMRKKATYGTEEYPKCKFSMFIHDPNREIFVAGPFFKALADCVRPDIVILTPEMRESEYGERYFYLDLLGKKYKIFELFKEA